MFCYWNLRKVSYLLHAARCSLHFHMFIMFYNDVSCFPYSDFDVILDHLMLSARYVHDDYFLYVLFFEYQLDCCILFAFSPQFRPQFLVVVFLQHFFQHFVWLYDARAMTSATFSKDSVHWILLRLFIVVTFIIQLSALKNSNC